MNIVKVADPAKMNSVKVADPLALELAEARVALRNRLINQAKIPDIKVSAPQNYSEPDYIQRDGFLLAAKEQHILLSIPNNRILHVQSTVCEKCNGGATTSGLGYSQHGHTWNSHRTDNKGPMIE